MQDKGLERPRFVEMFQAVDGHVKPSSRESRNGHGSTAAKRAAMKLDSLNLVQRPCGHVRLPTSRAMHNGNVFDHQQRRSLPVTAADPPLDDIFTAAYSAYHRFFPFVRFAPYTVIITRVFVPLNFATTITSPPVRFLPRKRYFHSLLSGSLWRCTMRPVRITFSTSKTVRWSADISSSA